MKLLTVKEAAERLGISVSRVHHLIRAGRLKARKLGYMWVIDSKDLAAVRERKPGRPRKKKTVRKKKG